MSSLGDLLQGKVGDQYPSPPDDVKVEQESYDSKQNDVDGQHGRDGRDKCDRSSPQSNDRPQRQAGSQILERIEKRRTKEDDSQSNASSTDDYVQELLDPNDRPRNVWHVVEGPKNPNNDDNGNLLTGEGVTPASIGKRSHHDRTPDDESSATPSRHTTDEHVNIDNPVKRLKVEPTEDNESFPLTHSPKIIKEEQPEPLGHMDHDGNEKDDRNQHHKGSPRHKRDEEVDRDRTVDEGHNNGESRTEKRDRQSSSSRHHHRDRHSSRDDDEHHHRRHHRDRHRDDRDKSHKSSRSRRDYSDEDERDDVDRHGRRGHGSQSRRHRKSRSSSRSRRRDRSDSRSPSTKRNSRTVLVMQLSQRVTTRDLEDFFSDIGDVREVRLIMDSKTRRHKGIAYIEFEDAKSAARALSQDGKKFLGAPLQIQSVSSERARAEWPPQAPSSASSHNHHHQPQHHHSSSPMLPTTKTTHPSSRSNLPPNSYRIYIGGLHVGITDEMLRTIVEPFGHILRIELIKDRTTGASRGYAFVLYATIADGQEAVRCLDGFELAGKHLRVSKSTEKGEREH